MMSEEEKQCEIAACTELLEARHTSSTVMSAEEREAEILACRALFLEECAFQSPTKSPQALAPAIPPKAAPPPANAPPVSGGGAVYRMFGQGNPASVYPSKRAVNLPLISKAPGKRQTRLSRDTAQFSDWIPYSKAWNSAHPDRLSFSFVGPTTFSLAVDPFGFRWALAALFQFQQTRTTPDAKNRSPESIAYRVTHQVLELCASAETHYREVFGTPLSRAAVDAEQYARRDAGMPWVEPFKLVTLSDRPLVMNLGAAAFPALSGGTPRAVLDHLQQCHESMMETLRSAAKKVGTV